MQPKPISETVMPLWPSVRVCMFTFLPSQSSRAVLLVRDLLHPVDILAVQGFRDRDVRHGRRGCRAVPVLLARRKPHDIAGPDLFNGPAFGLHPAEARGDDQRLAKRMGVPHGPGTGLERDLAAADAQRVADLEYRVDTHGACEPCLGAFAGGPRAVALDVHRLSPLCVRQRRLREGGARADRKAYLSRRLKKPAARE